MARIQRVFLLAVLPALVFAQETKLTGRMIQTGEFHGDEVTANTGEKWLALVPRSPNQARLSLVSIRVDPIQDVIIDREEEQTGKRVSFNKAAQQGVFLFKNIPGIRPGIIQTISSSQAIRPNEPVNLILKSGAKYTLTLICPPPSGAAKYETQTASLVLQRGNSRQILAHYSFPYVDRQIEISSSGSVQLFWAGDILQDGSLGLIVDLSDGYNGSHPALFIRSSNGSSNLVSLVAEFSSVGC